MRTAKTRISLRIHADWSCPSGILNAVGFIDAKKKKSECSDQTVWIYLVQTNPGLLLFIFALSISLFTWRGSIIVFMNVNYL